MPVVDLDRSRVRRERCIDGHDLDVADRVGADAEEERQLVVCRRLDGTLQGAEPTALGQEAGEEGMYRSGTTGPYRNLRARERGRDRGRSGVLEVRLQVLEADRRGFPNEASGVRPRL